MFFLWRLTTTRLRLAQIIENLGEDSRKAQFFESSAESACEVRNENAKLNRRISELESRSEILSEKNEMLRRDLDAKSLEIVNINQEKNEISTKLSDLKDSARSMNFLGGNIENIEKQIFNKELTER